MDGPDNAPRRWQKKSGPMSAPLFKAQEKNRIAGRRLQEAAVKAHPQNLPDIDCRDIRRAVARAMH